MVAGFFYYCSLWWHPGSDWWFHGAFNIIVDGIRSETYGSMVQSLLRLETTNIKRPQLRINKTAAVISIGKANVVATLDKALERAQIIKLL